MRIIRGFEQAERFLDRKSFHPRDRAAPPSMEARIRDVFGKALSPVEAVARIVSDVKEQGDDAVRDYTSRIDGVELESFEVPKARLVAAYDSVDAALIEALEIAAQRVQEFHALTVPKTWIDSDRGLGEIMSPLERVGLYVPGGTASYPSTVLMSAIPAKIAGVEEIAICTPPGNGGFPHPATLVAAHMAGVDRVFQVGGAQAIAAMAFGTKTIPSVDKICGPGNLLVALAKREVFGYVDIDGLYGPTETLIVADEFADPRLCAADLLAQAEHDLIAHPVLITTSRKLAAAVKKEIVRQLKRLERFEVAKESLERNGLLVIVDTLEEAFALANGFGPEHLCMLVREPWAHLNRVRHAGGAFLGEWSPEVIGDYVAGPSHVMPTGGTARFSSYLGIHHFLRPIAVVGLNAQDFGKVAPAALSIARAEGLVGHARAIEIRQADSDG